jgi:CheY-like chemotaxis protein
MNVNLLLVSTLLVLAVGVVLALVLRARANARRQRSAAGRARRTPRPAPASQPAGQPAAPARAAAAVVAPAPAPSAASAPAAPAHLLLVDDSAVVRAKLRKLFEGAGYTVELARDGLEAMQALAGSHFSVLVTDLEMPRMSGAELIASVQGNPGMKDLPIVAISGHDGLKTHVRDCQGLYGLFTKPWNDAELLTRVATLATLRKRVPARPGPAAAPRSPAAAREAHLHPQAAER